MHKIGIIGVGFVGSACEVGFSTVSNTEVLVHDKYKPTDSLRHVVRNSDIVFVCLPTPMREDGSCDTSIVFDGVQQAVAHAKKHTAFVIKSTVPPGTTDALQERFHRHSFFFNPEFLTEKNAFNDFLNQKHIIIGTSSQHTVTGDRAVKDAASKVHLFYTAFANAQAYASSAKTRMYEADNSRVADVIWTNARTAEMVKYATNCFLATKVSFFNELSQICGATGVDYSQIIPLLTLDDRIGKSHLRVPGPDGKHGFGGSCFPKDLNALMALAREKEVDPLLLEAVWTKNLIVRDGSEWEDLPQVNGQYKNAHNCDCDEPPSEEVKKAYSEMMQEVFGK